MTFKTLLLAGVALTASTPAFAQSAASDPVPATWIGDVVVTGARDSYATAGSASATRTDTPLIQVPQSVQVLTSSLLEEQGVRHLSDALVNVSGVTATQPQEVLFTPPLLRGFPGEVYVDGLPIFGGNQQAFDPAGLVGIERIEVLKGPSSALYGGGLGSPLGGLINIVSERPDDTFGGYFGVRAGSFSTWNPYGSVNVPLAEGVAARLSAEYQSSESWIDQVEGERWTIKPSLSVQLSPDTELLFQAQINRNSQLEYSGLPAEQALGGDLDRNAFPGAPLGQPNTRMENHLETVTLRHAFSDTLKLTVTGRYYDSEVLEAGSFVFPAFYAPDPATPTVYPILPMNMFTTTEEGALDANLQITANVLGGDHRFLVGVSYDRTKFYSGMAFTGVPVGEIDLADPTYTLPFGPLEPISLAQTDRYETSAIYVQDQVSYGRLHLTGSLRLTRLNFKEAEQGTDETYNHLSPRIGATFDVAPGIALYAGYATAFRAPFGFIGLETPEPETSENYEAGVKLALRSMGLSGTIAVFEQTRENVATPDPSNPLFSIQTGRQRARGLETDLIWEPTPAFSLLATYAYTDAEVTEDNALPVGDVLPRIPKNSGRITCLSDAQLAVVKTWTADHAFRGSAATYSSKGYPMSGNEDDPAGFGLWATGNGDVRQSGYFVMQDSTVQYYLARDPNADSLAYMPWDRNPAPLDAMAALNDATDPDIRAFIDGGGKLIVWHGGSDAALSVESTIDYMTAMNQAVGSQRAAAATRFYVAPGVNHCGGGAGPDQTDLLTALDRWVMENAAPATLLAEKLDADGAPVQSLPLCQYPQYPRYVGPANDAAARRAANFTCVAPQPDGS